MDPGSPPVAACAEAAVDGDVVAGGAVVFVGSVVAGTGTSTVKLNEPSIG